MLFNSPGDEDSPARRRLTVCQRDDSHPLAADRRGAHRKDQNGPNLSALLGSGLEFMAPKVCKIDYQAWRGNREPQGLFFHQVVEESGRKVRHSATNVGGNFRRHLIRVISLSGGFGSF